MFRFRCPAHKDNLIAHTEFTDFFSGFKLRMQVGGYSPEVVAELYDTCAAWVEQHILRIDVQLRPYRTPFYESERLAAEFTE